MNPYTLIGGILIFGGSVVGAFAYGVNVGSDHEKASQAELTKQVKDIREAATQAAAEAISKIKVTNVTRKQETIREIQEGGAIYRDCVVNDRVFDNLNTSLIGRSGAMPSQLPASSPVK